MKYLILRITCGGGQLEGIGWRAELSLLQTIWRVLTVVYF
jgi:hypothetical protein